MRVHWLRRPPEFDFYWNPILWEWRTVRFDHCTIRHRGPLTVTTYHGWASHHLVSE
jgi:hypothetical protein